MTTDILSIRIPPALLAEFVKLADDECRTPVEQALWLIKRAVEADRARQGYRYHRLSREQRLARSHDLLAELQLAYTDAGKPSYRKLQTIIADNNDGTISHTTLHQVLTGKIAPSWPVTQKISRALGADEERIHSLWVKANSD